MKSFCDAYTNRIHVNKKLIADASISRVNLISDGLNLWQELIDCRDFDHFQIIYPPSNIICERLSIKYYANKTLIRTEEITFHPWSLDAESINARVIRGTIVKKKDFAIDPLSLNIGHYSIPYKTEVVHIEPRNDGTQIIHFYWHLKKEHISTDIIQIHTKNEFSKAPITYLARKSDFTFEADIHKNLPTQLSNIDKKNYKIAIVMPIYNGIQETVEAIDSIKNFYENMSTNSKSLRFILGLDNPSNIEMQNIIQQKYGDNKYFTILINTTNLGFIQNCNKLFAEVKDNEEVILINSDVICPQKDWIKELIKVSNLSPNIGTVTPLSNCASIFSFPFPNANNDYVTPDHLESINSLLVNNTEEVLTVPSCHGFCVLILNTRLPIELKLDPIFGKGYGEENDLSVKIHSEGLLNIACPSIFIYHHESISFSEKKMPLLRRNLKILDERYPTYHSDVQNWVARDILRSYRNEAKKRYIIKHLSPNPIILHISHGRGGGTQEYIQNRANQAPNNYCHLLLSSNQKGEKYCNLSFLASLSNTLLEKTCLEVLDSELESIINWIGSNFPLEEIIIHSFIDFAQPNICLDFLRTSKFKTTAIIHDYEWISPNQNLLDSQLNIIPTKQSATVFNLDRIDEKIVFIESLEKHQIYRNNFLTSMNNVIFPSNTAEKILKKCYPDIHNGSVIYHDTSNNIEANVVSESLNKLRGARAKIAVIGAIGPNKGFDLLCELAREIYINKHPIELTVFGYTLNDDYLTGINPNIKITGKYKDKEDFQRLISLHHSNLSLFLSPWPETYSYTLSLAFENQLWPFVLDYGAIAERVRLTNFGSIIINKNPEAIVKKIMTITGP